MLVRCSGCFKRYPINPNKHQDRNTRYCPFCGTPRKVKNMLGRFCANPKWFDQKAEQAYNRTRLKEMRTPKQKQKAPPIVLPAENLLALSLAIMKRKKEIEEEQGQKSEKQTA